MEIGTHVRPGGRIRGVPTARWAAVGCAGAALLLGGCNAARFGAASLRPAVPQSEFELVLGPFDLGAGVTHDEVRQPAPLHAVFPEQGWMHGFTVEVTDETGDTVPSAVLHHVKTLMPARRELFHPISLRLMGAGSETRSISLPRTMGFPALPGDSLAVAAMLHNPTSRDLRGVRVTVRIRYTPVQPSRPPTDVYPFFAHVTDPLEDSHYELPAGYSEKSFAVRPAASGYVLGLGGHIHRYGVSLRLEDATSGRELWRSVVKTDANGEVLEIPRSTFFWNRGLRLHRGREYRVVAAYFNPTGEPIPLGGMGTIGGAFLPDGAWPEVRRDDPVYAEDLERELGDGHGNSPHVHH
jgi:hypothetical protein